VGRAHKAARRSAAIGASAAGAFALFGVVLPQLVSTFNPTKLATLSARVPLPPGEAGRWEAIGGAMEAVLRDAGPARGVFEGLLGGEAG
jgi:hypothetical protein